MILLDALGLLAVVGASALAQWRLLRFFEKQASSREAADEARQLALYKQQKAATTAIAQSDKAVRKMIDQSRSIRDDTRLLQQRTDAHFAHPAVKRLTNEKVDRG